MAEKSHLVNTLDQLESELRLTLLARGFCGRYRSYNRGTADGLTEVVNIQMGRFDPPGSYHTPINRNLYGGFTVNLGVFVPEVDSRRAASSPKSLIREYSCCIRARLGQLGPERRDIWWRVSADKELASDLRNRLERDAFPFLEKLSTRDAILHQWLTEEESPYGVPRIVCARILETRGEHARARDLLAAYAEETERRRPLIAEKMRRFNERLGLGRLPNP